MNPSGKILIVEDDLDVQRAARIALLPHVERVDAASSPMDLETRLATAAFDVVLLDMNFVARERSGHEGLDSLRRVHACDPTLSVVLMTAYGGVMLAVEALKQGAADFVLKPWRNEKLVDAVIAATNLTRTRRAAQTFDLDALERSTIERALSRHEGNISLAAAALGLSRPALYRRMSKYGL